MNVSLGRQAPSILIFPLVIIMLLWASCSPPDLLDEIGIHRPQAKFLSAQLTGLSFERADILFQVKIINPNAVGVTLAGFDYQFLVDDVTFLQGREQKDVTIAARGESTVDIPVVLSYRHLYAVLPALPGKDSAAYRLDCILSCELPLAGTVQVPTGISGELPLPKLPAVELEKITLVDLSPSSAEMSLVVRLHNPNAFSLILEGMQYQLQVDDRAWAGGETDRRVAIAKKGQGLFEIPFVLDFAHMGQATTGLLSGEKPFHYRFQGDLDLSPSLDLLGRTHLPFDLRGQTQVFK